MLGYRKPGQRVITERTGKCRSREMEENTIKKKSRERGIQKECIRKYQATGVGKQGKQSEESAEAAGEGTNNIW